MFQIRDFKSPVGDPRKLLDIYCDQGVKDVLVGTVADDSGEAVTYHCDSMRVKVKFFHDGTQPRVDEYTMEWEEGENTSVYRYEREYFNLTHKKT